MIFLSLISTFLLQTTIDVKAQEEIPQSATGTIGDQAYVINKDWLDVKAVSFDGTTIDSGGKMGRLNVDVGGFGLTNFVNHGEIAYDEETDTHVYLAEMTFPASVVVYTDAMIDDAYPSHLTGKGKIEWLHLTTCHSFFWQGYTKKSYYYYTEPSYIGTPGGIDTNEYDGNLRLSIKVNPILPIEENQTITMNGMVFKVPNIRSFIDSAIVVDRTYGTCDDPKNFYTDNTGVIPVRKEDLSDQSFPGLSDNDAEDHCGDGWDENEGMGASAPDGTAEELIDECGLHNRIRYYGVTYTSGEIGQAFASSPTIGTTWSRSNDLSDTDEEFIFDSHIRIKPNIFYDLETFEIKHKSVWVDNVKESVAWDYGLYDVAHEYTEKHERIVGLGVQNLFVKIKYNFKVMMLISIVPQSEEGETYLEDPEVYQGDIIWDNTILGETEADATIVEEKNWLTDIGDWWENALDGIGDWFSGIGDWFDGLLDDLLGGWTDWWDKFGLWIIIIIAIVVVVIVLFVVIRIIPKRKKYPQASNVVISGAEKKKTYR